MSLKINMYVFVSMYTRLDNVCMYVCLYVCIYACMHVGMYVCVYVHIHMLVVFDILLSSLFGVYIYIYTYTCACIVVFVWGFACFLLLVCLFVCLFACLCGHRYIHTCAVNGQPS